MQVAFEKELIKVYLPYLIPNLKQCAFAKEDMAFYWNAKFMKYPAALAFRIEADESFRASYHFDDDAVPGGKMTAGTYIPYIQQYSVKVFVEKQSEMIRLRDAMRIRYKVDPYVKLTDYAQEYPNMPIGLWLKKLSVEDLRSFHDEKGSQRVITFDFEANLVISDVEVVDEITDVNFGGLDI